MIPTVINTPHNLVNPLKPVNQSPPLNCWQKIWRAVCEFFSKLANCFCKEPILTNTDRQLLATYKKHRTSFRERQIIPMIQRQSTPKPIVPLLLEAPVAPVQPILPPAEEINVTRQQFVTVTLELAQAASAVVYEQQADKQLVKAIEKLKGFEEFIKGFLHFGISKLSESLCTKLLSYDDKNPLNLELTQSLRWWGDQNLDNLKLKVITKLNDNAEIKKHLSQRLTLENYIAPLIQWISSFKKESQDAYSPFNQLLPSPTYDNHVAETVKKVFCKQLMKNRIDEIIKQIDTTFRTDLPNHTKHFIDINVPVVAAELSNRSMDLLDNIPFSQFFDSIVTLFNTHIEGCIESESLAGSLLSKAEQLTPKYVKEPNSVDKQCGIVIDDIAKHGSKATLQNLTLDAFSQHRAAHQNVVTVLQADKPANYEGICNKIQLLLKATAFPTFINDIIALMLPSNKGFDNSQDMEGAVLLLKKLQFPKEIHEALHGMKDLGTEVLPEILLKLLSSGAHSKQSLIEWAIYNAKEHVSPNIVEKLHHLFEKLTDPSALNALAARVLLPALRELCLRTFIQQACSSNLKEMSPLFHALIEGKKNRDDVLRRIEQRWWTLAQSHGITFSLEKSGLTKEAFHEIVTPLIEKIEIYLLHFKRQMSDMPEPKILGFLTELFVDEKRVFSDAQHQLYGELFDNLIFKIGKFGSASETLCNIGWVRKFITSAMLSSTYETRHTHEIMVQQVSKSIQKHYGTKELFKNLIYGKPSPELADDIVQKNLEQEIKGLASLTYDLVLQSAEKGPIGTATIVRKILGKDTKDLEKVIKTIYHKCFGCKIKNISLLSQIQDACIKALKLSAKKIHQAQPS